MVRLKRPRAIICDIEGTTTSIQYWGECLVPFLKTESKTCFKAKWDDPVLQEIIDNVRNSTRDANEEGAQIPVIADKSKTKEFIINTIVDNLIEQINTKRYSKSLQQLQMYIWLFGFRTKSLFGHIFNDVPKAFNDWSKFQNIKIYTYSSAIYLCQKLLFACSLKGNLTPLIKDFLDTKTYGPKTSSDSFACIAKQIDVRVGDILFLSDNPKELIAAKEAGCEAVLVIRPNNPELDEYETKDFESIKDFNEIRFK